MEKDKEIVFILGSGRSGTTMVRDMLGKCPDVFVLPEMGFYDRYWSGRKFIGPINNKYNVQKYVTYLLHTCGDPLIKEYLHNEKKIREGVAKKKFNNEHDFFRGFMEVFSGGGTRVILEKTPGHLMFSKTIVNNFPDAKFIHVIRNPVDSVNSWIARGDLRGTACSVASDWVYSNLQLEKFKPRLANKILTVRYEDIVSEPEKQAHLLCNFLGLEFSNTMLKVGSNSSFHQEQSGAISASKTKKLVINQSEIEQVKQITAGLAGYYGYEKYYPASFAVYGSVGVFFRKIRHLMSLLGIRPFRALFTKIDAG